jgi:hypothetical protein
MVLRRSQAEETIMKNLNFGYPAFMVQGYISRIIQHLYKQGLGIALKPLEAGYQQISGNEAIGHVISSAQFIGLNPDGQAQQKIANGIADMNSKGYIFVKRVS